MLFNSQKYQNCCDNEKISQLASETEEAKEMRAASKNDKNAHYNNNNNNSTACCSCLLLPPRGLNESVWASLAPATIMTGRSRTKRTKQKQQEAAIWDVCGAAVLHAAA